MMPDHDQRSRRLHQALWLGRFALLIGILAVALLSDPSTTQADVPASCNAPGVNMVNPSTNVACFPGNTFYSSAYWWGSARGSGQPPGSCAQQGVPYWRLRWAYKIVGQPSFLWTKIQTVGTGLTAPTNDLAASEWISNEKYLTCRIPATYTLTVLAIPNDPFIIRVVGGSITKSVTVTPYDSNNIQAEKGTSAPTIDLTLLGQWWTPARDCATQGCEARLFNTPPAPGAPIPELRNYNWDTSGVTFTPNDHPRFYSSGFYGASPPEFGAVVLKDQKYFERSIASSLPQAGNYYITLRTGFTQLAGGTPPPERLETSIIRGGAEAYSFVTKRPNDGFSDTRFYQCVSRDPYYLTPTDTIRFTGLDQTVHLDWYRIQGNKPAGVPDCDEAAPSAPPQISSVLCDKGDGIFLNCGLVRFNEKITRLQVDCSDADNNNTISRVTVALDGLTSGHVFDMTAPLATPRAYPNPNTYIASVPVPQQIPLKNDTYTVTANCVSGAVGNPDSQTDVYISTWAVGAGSPPAVSNIECKRQGGSGYTTCDALDRDDLVLESVRAQCSDPDSVPGAATGWTNIPGTIPGGGDLTRHAAAEANGKLYVIGGQTAISPATYSNRVWEFDPANNSWAAKTDLPGPARGSLAATTINNRIFVTGGFDGAGPVNRLDIFDPVADSWSSGQAMNVPRYAHKTTTANGKLYLIGGIDSTGSTILDPREYDIQTNLWQAMAGPGFIASPVSDHAFVAHGNELYVIGGTTATGPTRQVIRFMLDQALWGALPDAPAEFAVISRMTAHEIIGKIYLFGGGNSANDAFNYVFEYTPEQPPASAWKTLHDAPENMPMANARFNHASAYAAGKIYLFGGFAASGFVKPIEAFAPGVPAQDDVASVTFTLSSGSDIFTDRPGTYDVASDRWQFPLAPPLDLENETYVLKATCKDKKNFLDDETEYWYTDLAPGSVVPAIVSITPGQGYNNDPAAPVIDLAGSDISDDVNVWLETPAAPGVHVADLANVVVDNSDINDVSVSGTFDLRGIAAGIYNVRLEDAIDGTDATGDVFYSIRQLPEGVQTKRPTLDGSLNGTSSAPDVATPEFRWTFNDPNSCQGGSIPAREGVTCDSDAYCGGVIGSCKPSFQTNYHVVIEKCIGNCTNPRTAGNWQTVEDSWQAGAATDYTPAAILDEGSIYRWRVQTQDNAGITSPWSFRQEDGGGGDWLNYTDNIMPGLPDETTIGNNDPTKRIAGYALAIHPINADLRYLSIVNTMGDALASPGLYKSVNAGQTWTRLTLPNPIAPGDLPKQTVLDIVLRANDEDWVMVGTYYNGPPDGLFVSEDQGAIWSRVEGPFDGPGVSRIHPNTVNENRFIIENGGSTVSDAFVVQKDPDTGIWTQLFVGNDTSGASNRADDAEFLYQGESTLNGSNFCQQCITKKANDASDYTCNFGLNDGLSCSVPQQGSPECPYESLCLGGGPNDWNVCTDNSQCPDGKFCQGGSNDGTACTDNSQCLDGGSCVIGTWCQGGSNESLACTDNGDCPGGTCVPRAGFCSSFGNADCMPSPPPTDCRLDNADSGVNGSARAQFQRIMNIIPHPFRTYEDFFYFTWNRSQAVAAGNAHVVRTTTSFDDPDGAGGTPACQSIFQFPPNNSRGFAEYVSGFRLEPDLFDEHGLFLAPAESDSIDVAPQGHNGEVYRISDIVDVTPPIEFSPIALPLPIPNPGGAESTGNDFLDLAVDSRDGTLWASTRNYNYGSGLTGWLWNYNASWGYFQVAVTPPPTVTAISPDYGFSTDITPRAVTITGQDFRLANCAGGRVELRDPGPAGTVIPLTCTSANSTTIQGTFPLFGTPVNTLYDLYVENADGDSGQLNNAFFVYGVGNLTGFAWSGATDPASTSVPDCGSGAGIAPCATPGWLALSCTSRNLCSAQGGIDYGTQFTPINNNQIDLRGFSWFGLASTGGGQPIGWTQFDPDVSTAPDKTAGPETTVRLDPVSGKVEGWARILKLRDDGTLFQCNSSNPPPVILGTSDQTMNEGESRTMPITITDVDGINNGSVSVVGGPAFITVTPAGGNNWNVNINPPVGSAATYSGIQISATDNNPSPATGYSPAFQVTVLPGNQVRVYDDIDIGEGTLIQTFTQIQPAINFAQNGWRAEVWPGTYVENINFNGKNIRVHSIDPNDSAIVDATIIDGNNAGTTVTFSSGSTNTAVLDGMTVMNGNNSGVVVGPGAWPTIDRSVIRNNSAPAGGGIRKGEVFGNSATVINRTTIRNNIAGEGGGILTENNMTITNSTISNNVATALYGGGIYTAPSPWPFDVTIDRSVFSGNNAVVCAGGGGCGDGIMFDGLGGGIRNGSITNSIIDANDRNGIYIREGTRTNVQNSVITNHTSTGVRFFNNRGWLTNSTLVGNSTGVYCGNGPGPTMVINNILDNTFLNRDNCVQGDVQYNVLTPIQSCSGTNVCGTPIFVNPTAGDYHLAAFSPGIDAANNNEYSDCPNACNPTTDADNNSRFDDVDMPNNGVGPLTYMDIGAYERQTASVSSLPPLVGSVRLYDAANTLVNSFDNIQDAIVAAANGQRIEVDPGTYTENINFLGKAIRVHSMNPTDPTNVVNTVIDGNQQGSTVTFNSGEGAGSILEGFTIYNGSGTLIGPTNRYGGGILVDTGSSPLIQHNIITNNRNLTGTKVHGGGIAVRNGSQPTITDNTISNNEAILGWGGGVMFSSSNASISNNVISGNKSNEGAGLATILSSVTVSGNQVSDNAASQNAGGMYIEGASSPVIQNSTFSNNTAVENAGAMMIGYGATAQITSTTFSDNRTLSIVPDGFFFTGGAISVKADASATITTSVITDNVGEVGGGIACYANSVLTIRRSSITNNSGSYEGGGINATSCDLVVDQTSITSNAGPARGGGIFMVGQNGNVAGGSSVVNSLIARNQATGSGAGIYLASNAGSTFQVLNSTIANNTGGIGGGLFLSSAVGTTVANSILADNSGNQIEGGALSSIRYSDVKGQAMAGAGNISTAPNFVDAANGDFHLGPSSPGIDAADGNLDPATDLEGSARYNDANVPNTGIGSPTHVDMGAFERQSNS